MTKINSMTEAEEVLAKYVPLSREITGRDITLNRMVPLMKVLGNPEKKLKIIHVAGTSGKTSTAYFVASMLTSSGRKVGLTVSPHVDSVAERVQINMKPLGESEFTASLSELIDIVKKAGIEPTYFELLVAFAFWYFDKAGVDYAVVETGLGGLHDGTNIASNPDKICIITDIGIDHTQVLGSTIEKIALQKAGIIHKGNEVFMNFQPNVADIFQNYCTDKHAELFVVEPQEQASAPDDLPDFQKRNWALAQRVYKYICSTDDLSEQAIVGSIVVPGRMDTVQIGQKTVIMDGAHNQQKMQAFVDSFIAKYPGIRVPVLISLKKGKEYQGVLDILKPITDKMIITSFQQAQDLPIGPIDASIIKDYADKIGVKAVVEQDIDRAYKLLLDQDSKLVIITGSFYLISQLRKQHKELINV